MHNNGEWTDARFRSFVKSALRAASRKWPPKYGCLNDAFVGKQVCKVSGRLGKHYRCGSCDGVFAGRFVQVDHIDPIIDPVVGFRSWDEVVDRLFCEKENLQVLCLECHQAKTAAERKLKKEHNATK